MRTLAYKILMDPTLVLMDVWMEPPLIAVLLLVTPRVADMTMVADRLADAPRARHAKAECA
jgi:hypothetical protein